MTPRPNRTYHLTPVIHARMSAYLEAHDGTLAGLRESDRLRDQLRRVFAHGTNAERQALLALGWEANPLASGWDAKFARLLEFRAEHGTAHATARYKTTDGVKLGIWYHWQRSRARAGKLPLDRRQRLQAAGLDLPSGLESAIREAAA